MIDRWSVYCCQTGMQIQKLGITAEGEPSSTFLSHWLLTCRRREWSPHQGPSQRAKTSTAAAPAVVGVAGGFPESSRAIWTHCGYWTLQQRPQRMLRGMGRLKGEYRESRLWADWMPGCTAGTTEPRSSTAHPSGTLERWEEERNCPAVLSEPDRCPTCLDKDTPAIQKSVWFVVHCSSLTSIIWQVRYFNDKNELILSRFLKFCDYNILQTFF